MSGRTHDFHCPECHTWMSGFDFIGDKNRCPEDRAEMFYDLNLDGCPTETPCWKPVNGPDITAEGYGESG